jgi:hypothetical protein
VNDLAHRNRGLDRSRQEEEFLGPLALHATAEHGTRQDIKGSKQCRRAVTDVVMGLGGRMTGGEWPVEAGALQRLDLMGWMAPSAGISVPSWCRRRSQDRSHPSCRLQRLVSI